MKNCSSCNKDMSGKNFDYSRILICGYCTQILVNTVAKKQGQETLEKRYERLKEAEERRKAGIVIKHLRPISWGK